MPVMRRLGVGWGRLGSVGYSFSSSAYPSSARYTLFLFGIHTQYACVFGGYTPDTPASGGLFRGSGFAALISFASWCLLGTGANMG